MITILKVLKVKRTNKQTNCMKGATAWIDDCLCLIRYQYTLHVYMYFFHESMAFQTNASQRAIASADIVFWKSVCEGGGEERPKIITKNNWIIKINHSTNSPNPSSSSLRGGGGCLEHVSLNLIRIMFMRTFLYCFCVKL